MLENCSYYFQLFASYISKADNVYMYLLVYHWTVCKSSVVPLYYVEKFFTCTRNIHYSLLYVYVYLCLCVHLYVFTENK